MYAKCKNRKKLLEKKSVKLRKIPEKNITKNQNKILKKNFLKKKKSNKITWTGKKENNKLLLTLK